MRIDHRGPTARRIAEKQVGEGERNATATDIGCGSRVGNLDGVHVDFRHQDLPADDWEARPFWHVWGDSPAHAGILFPGEAASGTEAELRAEKGGLAIPLLRVEEGDRITIESVVVEVGDRRFDHPHDVQRRSAFLRIDRRSGEVVRPHRPMMFYGRTQIRKGALRESFDHILARVCAHAGVQTPYIAGLNGHFPGFADGGHWSWDRPLEELARYETAEAHDAFFELAARLDELGAAHLRRLINSASLAGFLLAKVEARKAEKTAAGVMLNREAATKKVTRLDWRARAQEIWAEHPDYRRTRVAKMIAEENPDDDQSSIMRALKPIDPHLKH